ncbi:MAG: double-strand break repair helicase AddA [Hyphomicrobiales bacterium]
MSGSPKFLAVPEATQTAQRTAADPGLSAWVSANAGSGKTHVLAQRVERLLLAGTNPARILCLTFTKAAAAQMSNRVFAELGRWAVASDADLDERLREMTGQRPEAGQRARARRLFAEALETPGGLKIQTIHAFCDRLLHAFPFEAGVSGHFDVLDDTTGAELLAEARAAVFERAVLAPDSDTGRALSRLIEASSDSGVEKALSALVGKRDALSSFAEESPAGIGPALSDVFGIAADESAAAITTEILSPPEFPAALRLRLAEALLLSGKEDTKIGEGLVTFGTAASATERLDAWLGIFLTEKGTPRARVGTKKIHSAFPDLAGRVEGEQTRLLRLLERQRAIAARDTTLALLTLGQAVISHYERAKARRGLLDYEDLVVRTARLLRRGDTALWVQYKLDRGIDHILVDEAQDTSPRQWQVIEALAGEFFTGESARRLTRTMFAVGDEKQSIYSFQGAVPAYFDRMLRHFRQTAAAAEAAFEEVRLTLSFRSAPEVLQAVDTVFAEPEHYAGLTGQGEPTVHEAIRSSAPGRVEIWPAFLPVAGGDTPEHWWEPVDALGAASPERRHAAAIAARIADWFAGPDRPVIGGRPARFGDILVLVRKRGSFAGELLRALKERGLPVAGADRLVLTNHVAVADLLTLAGFMLLPEDDYSLAVVLKSPLFGFDDDDLMRLTEPEGDARPGDKPLWQRLERLAGADTRLAAAHARLSEWRRIADFVPPFEFLARVLGPDGGRRQFEERLGAEANEALDELLAQALEAERAGPPTLQGFLDRLTRAAPEIKRDMDIGRDEIRVMTVHGAKGLEAPIVFLADTCSAPGSSKPPQILMPERPDMPPDTAPALIFSGRKDDHTGTHTAALAEFRAREAEEYRRLLYVAMTRAGDQLIISGHAGARGVPDDSWYAMTRRSLESLADAETRAGFEEPVLVWARKAAPEPILPDEGPVAAPLPVMPDWIGRPAPAARRAARRLQPSDLGLIPAGLSGGPRDAARRGEAVHRLLESLAPLAPADRPAAAARALLTPGAGAGFGPSGDEGDEIAQEALAVLDHPGFAFLFAEGSRGEVAVAGEIEEGGERYRVEGRIDRLVVRENDVLIVDYKTSRSVPDGPGDVAAAHIAQLALYRRLIAEIYPGREIGCALLFTAGPRLIVLDGASLSSALAALPRISAA